MHKRRVTNEQMYVQTRTSSRIRVALARGTGEKSNSTRSLKNAKIQLLTVRDAYSEAVLHVGSHRNIPQCKKATKHRKLRK